MGAQRGGTPRIGPPRGREQSSAPRTEAGSAPGATPSPGMGARAETPKWSCEVKGAGGKHLNLDMQPGWEIILPYA